MRVSNSPPRTGVIYSASINSPYADTIADLDLKLTEPMYFTVGPIIAGRTTKLEDS